MYSNAPWQLMLYGLVRTIVAALELLFLRPAESTLMKRLREAKSYKVCSASIS